MLPDSPRYLASVGRYVEAKEVLLHVRGGDSAQVEEEFLEICAVAETGKPSSPVEVFKILLGRASNRRSHLGRRAWLCVWLQIMASWTGITVRNYADFQLFPLANSIQAVTAYSPVLLSQAGYSSIKQNGLAGGLNTIGIVGTIISATIVDKFGRRLCLMWGAAGLFAVNLIVRRLC